MGCECDAGYFGPDCSQRSCKVGVDPLYLDDTATIKYSIFDFAVLTTDVVGSDYGPGSGSYFDDGTPSQGKGYWAIKFYDHSGEDWVTSPIPAGATCNEVVAALEAIPNDVIPAGQTECINTQHSNTADNLFVNSVASGNDQDYKITYRMSIWDAYVYTKFGDTFQDVLSVKTPLGNQVYSPLLWLPGSMTMPWSDAEQATVQLTTLNSGLGIKVLDASRSAGTPGVHPIGTAVAAQAAGSGVFYVEDTGTISDAELATLAQHHIIQVFPADTNNDNQKTCGASGWYTIKTSSYAKGGVSIAVNEAVPEMAVNDECYIQIDHHELMGSGAQMQDTLEAAITVTSTAAGGTTVPITSAKTTAYDNAGVITFSGTADANDAGKFRKGVKIEITSAGGSCDVTGVYTILNYVKDTNDKLTVYEAIGADSTGDCRLNIYNGNLPGAARQALTGDIYRIKFFGNPGKLRQPEIVTHLDGKRNSLMSTEFSGSTETTGEPTAKNLVITKVFTDGQQGEDKDYFADHCDGVTVTIDISGAVADPALAAKIASTGYSSNQNYLDANINRGATWSLGSLDAAELLLLKSCLGGSDLTETNNVEVHNWDYGDADYPHLIKLVRTVTTLNDGGYYVAIYWDGSKFVMLNPFSPPDAMETDVYEVYTTKGVLARVSSKAQAYFGFGQKKVITTHTLKTSAESGWDGDISCEIGDNNGFRMAVDSTGYDADSVPYINFVNTTTSGTNAVNMVGTWYKNCVNKTDMITFLNWNAPALNPPKINLYTVERLVKDESAHTNKLRYGNSFSYAAGSEASSHATNGDLSVSENADMNFGTNVITLDLATNWAVELYANSSVPDAVYHSANRNPFYIYKFIPNADSTYEYVAECSNRGLCNNEAGVCECFTGYTNDACDSQDSLSL